MVEQKRVLPEFESPPVIETVLGVQFNRLESFQIPHFGLYWNRVRQIYPRVEIQPPLSPAFEHFAVENVSEEFEIRLSGGPPELRCWFKNEEETHLIQIQRDRFIINWRKVTGKEEYPRYHRFRPRFQDEWIKFCNFLREEAIDCPQVNQCEVTYVNHFECEKEFKHLGEVHKMFRVWSELPREEFLPSPEAVRFHMRFALPDQKGRLHVVAEPKIRTRDAKPVLQLMLTCRGRPDVMTTEGILDWFDLGHEWIVESFTELTTHEMHQLWRRTV
ncbi:MAG: TIGR04255 family protein [Nitrospirae bacterium]|nr:MAG: TIGR04255 family protein [Nitrospirota bacterium]